MLILQCPVCHIGLPFGEYNKNIRHDETGRIFCSNRCLVRFRNPRVREFKLTCTNCHIDYTHKPKPHHYLKSIRRMILGKSTFCSLRCSDRYRQPLREFLLKSHKDPFTKNLRINYRRGDRYCKGCQKTIRAEDVSKLTYFDIKGAQRCVVCKLKIRTKSVNNSSVGKKRI